MLVILLVVFLAVFALFVLVMMGASGRSTSQETVRATLDSVLFKTFRPAGEEVVDVRKNVAMSSISLMNRLLARLQVASHLRRVLD